MEDGDNMSETPYISIIMPVYNAQSYLRESIGSVLAQTYPDFELVIIDDGSSDDSYALCYEFAVQDSRIRLFQKENGGPGAARNFGLEHACGEYVLFVDSDDIVEPYCLQRLIELVQQHNADAVIYNFDNLSSEGELLESGQEHPICSGLFCSDDIFTMTYEKNGYVFSFLCNKMIRRQCFGELRFAPLRMCEDEVLFPRILDRCQRICMTEEVLYHYYRRSGSVMHQEFSSRNVDQLFSYFDRYRYYLQTNRRKLAQIAGKTYWDNLRRHFIQYDLSNEELKPELKTAQRHFASVRAKLLCNSLLTMGDKLQLLLFSFSPSAFQRYIQYRSK